MKEIVNKFSLVGDKYMPEMHLEHHGLTYSACGTFTKKIKKEYKSQKLKVIHDIFIKIN